MPRLRSFTEVEGWRESFREAARRLDEVRVGSLFTDPTLLCGESVLPFSFRAWTVLHQGDNPFVSGGERTTLDALKVIWVCHTEHAPRSKKADKAQAKMFARVLRRFKGDELAIIEEVEQFVDDAFIDSPGRFSRGDGKRIAATEWPRIALDVGLCSEVMAAFPSFRFAELWTMPLAQLWQWLHSARRLKNPEYRNYQLTDDVNARACRVLNQINRQAAEEAVSKN
jgi:hypothetical protein